MYVFAKIVTRVPKCTKSELEEAVLSAKEAYKTWSKTSVLTRQQIMFKYQSIIRSNMVCNNVFFRVLYITVCI